MLDVINQKKAKVINILEKLIFIIEFIAAVLLSYSIYEITIFKNSSDIWPLKYILISIPSAISIIGVIIFQFKKNKDKIEKMIITFLIPIGMMYIFFIAPSYAPDEHAHIWKAYEVSTGRMITHINEDGSSPTEIPKFFNENRIPVIKKYGDFENAKNKEIDYNQTVQVDNPAQNYPAILYLISSIAFAIGRIFSINGIWIIYAARMLNFIIFLVLGYYSIKIIPLGKWIIGIILFLPMSLQQATSISADCVLNALAIFFIAYTLYICINKENIELKDKICYILLGIILGISKIAYFPMIGLSLLLLKLKNMSKKNKVIFIVTAVIITTIFSLSWYIFMQKYEANDSYEKYMEANNVDSSEQVKMIINHPQNILNPMFNALHDGGYLESLIGKQLGWLNIEISQGVIMSFFALLILSPYLDKNENELSKLDKTWIFLIGLGIYLLIILTFYITYTSVGAAFVAGVQGRYFIPILALPLLCLCKKERYIEIKNVNFILPIFMSFLNMVAISDIVKFFI